jgi:transcriptional regulator with XRE-family HTH domain
MTTNFRDQRLERGWTLRDLSAECDKAGVPAPSSSHLSSIERGRTTPRPPLRRVLADLLDLPDGVHYFDKNEVSA